MDFCRKSSGFNDFENTVDRGSAVNFGADFGMCPGLADMLMSSTKSFFFSNETQLNSDVRLLLELHCVMLPSLWFVQN